VAFEPELKQGKGGLDFYSLQRQFHSQPCLPPCLCQIVGNVLLSPLPLINNINFIHQASLFVAPLNASRNALYVFNDGAQ